MFLRLAVGSSLIYREPSPSTEERRTAVYIVTPRFMIGWILVTPGALVALVEAQEDPKTFLYRHIQGDWGDVGPKDWAANEEALRFGERLFSIYHTRKGVKLWVITEADRYSTTILLPEEY
jgi:hypothetical protein